MKQRSRRSAKQRRAAAKVEPKAGDKKTRGRDKARAADAVNFVDPHLAPEPGEEPVLESRDDAHVGDDASQELEVPAEEAEKEEPVLESRDDAHVGDESSQEPDASADDAGPGGAHADELECVDDGQDECVEPALEEAAGGAKGALEPLAADEASMPAASGGIWSQYSLHLAWAYSTLGQGAGDYQHYGEAYSDKRAEAGMQALATGGLDGGVDLAKNLASMPLKALGEGPAGEVADALDAVFAQPPGYLNDLAGELAVSPRAHAADPWGQTAAQLALGRRVLEEAIRMAKMVPGKPKPLKAAMAAAETSVTACDAAMPFLLLLSAQSMDGDAAMLRRRLGMVHESAKGAVGILLGPPPGGATVQLIEESADELQRGDKRAPRSPDVGGAPKLAGSAHPRVQSWEEARRMQDAGEKSSVAKWRDGLITALQYGTIFGPLINGIRTGAALLDDPQDGLRSLPAPPVPVSDLEDGLAEVEGLQAQLEATGEDTAAIASSQKKIRNYLAGAEATVNTSKREQKRLDGEEAALDEGVHKIQESEGWERELKTQLNEFLATHNPIKVMRDAAGQFRQWVRDELAKLTGEEEVDDKKKAELDAQGKAVDQLLETVNSKGMQEREKIAEELRRGEETLQKARGDVEQGKGELEKGRANMAEFDAKSGQGVAEGEKALQDADASMLSAKQRAAQLRAELSKAQLAVADTRGTLETWVPVHELEARHNDNAAEKIQVGTADGDGALEPAQAQQLKRRAMAELVRCRVWLQSQAGDLRHDEGVPGGLKPGVRGGVEVVGQLDISAAIDQLRGATTPDEILEAAAAALDLVGRLRERFGTVSEPGGDPGEPEADELEGETPPPNARVMFDRDFPRGGRDGVLAAPRMGEVYQYVRRNRNAKVHLTGHASVPGSKRYNRSLAQRRADVVRRMIADATGHTHVSARAVGEGSPERPHTAGNEAEAKKAQGHKPDNPTWQRVDVEVQSPSGVDGE